MNRLRRPGSDCETSSKKASVGYSLVSLDQFPAADPYALERLDDLLGQQRRAVFQWWLPHRLGQTTLFHFFPDAFWRALGLQYQLARGMAWHFFFIWFFAINGFLYVSYLLVSGEWRFLVPQSHALLRAFQVLLHDLHLRKTLQNSTHFSKPQK